MNLKFLIPGFSKCGTTTLCALMEKHPDIFISKPKEPNFFSREDYRDNWHWYEEIFNGALPSQYCGEGSTFYTTIKHEVKARNNILESHPNIKLIFIARDPVSRIESAYREFHHSGPMFGIDCPYGLENAIDTFPAILEDTMYWSRIYNYLKHFPKENIHVVFTENLKSNPHKTISECISFLGLDPEKLPNDLSIQLNSGTEKLYDTKFLRKMRNTPHIGPYFSKISFDQQNRLTKAVGLRRKFNSPIEWTDQTRDLVLKTLDSEISEFLSTFNTSIDIWSRYLSLLESKH